MARALEATKMRYPFGKLPNQNSVVLTVSRRTIGSLGTFDLPADCPLYFEAHALRQVLLVD